jgi:hypothetical protein
MSLNTDRLINRATVVGCGISATRNHLKLHMPRTLNPLLSNIHAKTRKLWKRFAMRVAASRPDAVHQSTNRPLMHSACARRDAHRALLGSPACRHAHHLMLAPRVPSRAAPTCNPHRACCTAGCPTHRDFVPWRFSATGRPITAARPVARRERERAAAGFTSAAGHSGKGRERGMGTAAQSPERGEQGAIKQCCYNPNWCASEPSVRRAAAGTGRYRPTPGPDCSAARMPSLHHRSSAAIFPVSRS